MQLEQQEQELFVRGKQEVSGRMVPQLPKDTLEQDVDQFECDQRASIQSNKQLYEASLSYVDDIQQLAEQDWEQLKLSQELLASSVQQLVSETAELLGPEYDLTTENIENSLIVARQMKSKLLSLDQSLKSLKSQLQTQQK